jgi:hypothetical protein
MDIVVDTVYQRVLALANKEQRGYITPQEFNLFACQAQLEIIERYFYDLNQFNRLAGNDTEYSDMETLVDEKLSRLKTTTTLTPNSSGQCTLPNDIYRLGSIFWGGVKVDKVSTREYQLLNRSTLTKPKYTNSGLKRPVAVMESSSGSPGIFTVYPNPTFTGLGTPISITYTVLPYCPVWGYFVINEKAMYDPNSSQNFILHNSEETELVNRILALSGVTLKQPDLTQTAMAIEGQKQQNEKQ